MFPKIFNSQNRRVELYDQLTTKEQWNKTMEDETSTDGETSSMLEAYGSKRTSTDPDFYKYTRQLRATIWIVSSVAILAWVLLFLRFFYDQRQIFCDDLPATQGQAPPTLVKEAPDFGSRPVTWVEDRRFMGNTTEVLRNWYTLMPNGNGFVNLTAEHDNMEGYYVVSAFHQVHCIQMFRSFINEVVAGSDNPTPYKYSHLEHCIEYMRQAVMCSADPTLESTMPIPKEADPHQGEEGHVHLFTDGEFNDHSCRNYEALREWTENHRYRNTTRTGDE